MVTLPERLLQIDPTFVSRFVSVAQSPQYDGQHKTTTVYLATPPIRMAVVGRDFQFHNFPGRRNAPPTANRQPPVLTPKAGIIAVALETFPEVAPEFSRFGVQGSARKSQKPANSVCFGSEH
jgi:hypothetical protein